MDNLLIFLGAGLGGVLRYWISRATYMLLGHAFPYGTLIVNVSGCFLMGLLFVLILERFNGIGTQLRAFCLIGMLGGYTTFSSFSIETMNLFESGHGVSALLNIFLNVGMCIGAAWLGMIEGKSV